MFKKLWILSILLLTGCASTPKVWHYRDFTIIKADLRTVRRACYLPHGTMDDGTPQIKERIQCCWLSDKKEIWISEQNPECLVHELCHQQNIHTGRTCGERYRWDE